MVQKTAKFTIKDQELAEVLEISLAKLYEIIEFFDAHPDDEWELKDNDHFVYTNRTGGDRNFSAHGAFAIAKYLDIHEKKSLWDRLCELITRHKEKIRNAFVHRKVHENSSSLTYRNGRYFLSRKDTVAILSTSHARLNQSFKDIRRSEQPLEIFVDFDDIEGVRYYSLSGFFRLSKNLSKTLTSKERREWCGAVNVAGKGALKAITDDKENRRRKISNAMARAKTRDKKTCQITREKATQYNESRNMASHHIFSSSHYPHLAATVDNIITLTDKVHEEFHRWNGGNTSPCTVDNLIQFVCDRYPENPDVMTRLYEVKRIFAYESSLADQRKPSDRRSFPGNRAA